MIGDWNLLYLAMGMNHVPRGVFWSIMLVSPFQFDSVELMIDRIHSKWVYKLKRKQKIGSTMVDSRSLYACYGRHSMFYRDCRLCAPIQVEAVLADPQMYL